MYSSHVRYNCLINLTFQVHIVREEQGAAGSAREDKLGNEHENKAGESSKSGGLGMLSGMPRSGLDPETVIRARRSPGIKQQVCSDKAGPRLGQEG